MVLVKSITQFSSTVCHLRSSQITGQIKNRLNRIIEVPQLFTKQCESKTCECVWRPKKEFVTPCIQGNREDLLNGYFNFLNNKMFLSWPPVWDKNDISKLWLYNLHYFDYLWVLDYFSCKELVIDWIEKNPLGKNNIGWDSYPISLRLMNWCSLFFQKYYKQTQIDESFLEILWRSIYTQAQWLIRHLEYHLLGNHLLENAAALLFVGNCFDCDASRKWYRKGKDILGKEITEQILPDGFHFERSPMYHLRLTTLFANLLNINNPDLNNLVSEPLKQMLNTLEYVCHPDGDISLLNDSAFNIYNKPSKIISYSQNLLIDKNTEHPKQEQSGCFALPEAGYYGYRDTNGTYIICDFAKIGPDYLPGHSHADIFSFELSLRGHRVFVDSGVYDYERSQMRQYCRSTKAHNTIEIDEQDQCEMWAAFRVARRGQPANVVWEPSGNSFQLSGTHDGYKRLKGNPIHYRKLVWGKNGKLTIQDKIDSSYTHEAKSRLHLHPDCNIDDIEHNTAWITYPKGRFKVIFTGNGNLFIEDSLYCPEFGIKIPNKSLVFSSTGINIEIEYQIEVL